MLSLSDLRSENRPDMDNWKDKVYQVIFEADTPLGKYFDIGLIICILASVTVVMLCSVDSIRAEYQTILWSLEWFFTLLFTAEYVLRLICVRSKMRYATSFFGIIDLLAVIPTYLTIFLPGGQYLMVIRILRMLRIFRVLKLVQYLQEVDLLMRAMRDSSRKIIVFFFAVLNLVIILGSMMYVIEGQEHGFTSIPKSIYWAIITMTTVGYGDIVPITPLGQTLASVIMILGYSIIALPTGIVTHSIIKITEGEKEKDLEIREETHEVVLNMGCPGCGFAGHDIDARYCKFCGTELKPLNLED
ncbi:MAG: ion transporter [Euryarchaeota archaeon]|nr:ion transporter [Euryarchaeota archaeon]